MFTFITNTATPIKTSDYAAGAGLIQFGTPPSTGIIQTTLTPPNLNSTTYSVPYTEDIPAGSNVTLEAPDNLSYLQGVVVNGQIFSVSYTSNITGTAYYNPSSNTITVYGINNSSYSPTSVQIYGGNNLYERTTEVDYPTDVVHAYDLTGTVSISRQFENHPSASIELIADDSNIDATRNTFKQGKLIDIYSMGFRVASYSEVAESNRDYPHGFYKVNVSLEGKYALPLEETIFLRISTPVNTGDPTTYCSSTSIVPNHPGVYYVDLKTLAAKTNINYIGHNFLVMFPNTTPIDQTTTFINELTSRVRPIEHFVFYSDKEGLSTRNFRTTKTWILAPEDIIGNVSTNKRIRPVAYKAVELQIDPYVMLPSVISPPPNNVINTIVDDPENAATPPAGYTSVKTTDINFDSSGTVKIKKETTYENDTIIKEVVTKYGFAFRTIDAFSFSGNGTIVEFTPSNANIFWKIVEQITTIYNYSNTTGYLLSITSSGYKLARFEQEPTPSPVPGYTTNPSDAPLIDLYTFKQIPYFSQTSYELRQFKDYYRDVNGNNNLQVICDINGNPKLVAQADPGYVEPMFVYRSQTVTRCFAYTTVLSQFIELYGDSGIRVTGEESIMYSQLKIYTSSNTIGGGTIGTISAGNKTEDRYTEYVHTYTSQDPGFRSVTERMEENENQGRPPEATRKKAPVPNNLPNLFVGKTILTTPGYSPYNPSGGSINYVNATYDEAVTAAKIDLKIKDTQETETYSFSTFYNPEMAEGDQIVFFFNNEMYKGTIFSNTSALEIGGTLVGEDKAKTYGITNLNIGKASDIDNSIVVTNLPPFLIGTTAIPLITGGLLTPISIGRGNF